MLLTGTLFICLMTIVIVYLSTLNCRYSYFKQRGIPTPPYCFFFGHDKNIWSTSLLSRQLQTWTRQFSSIYGLYEGTRPLYVVSDVEFLHEVFIRQFSSFNSRRLPFILKRSKGDLFSASGAKWHRQRQVINPSFSSAKLKLVTSLVNECIESLMKKLLEKSETQENFNIYTLYKRLTMDVICK
jgi:cytochrome P450 family 3 subfamily A